MTGQPWECPNTPPCPHGGFLHDVEDPEDQTPTCCAAGCTCGHAQRAIRRAFVARLHDPEVRTVRTGDTIKTLRTLGVPDVTDIDWDTLYRPTRAFPEYTTRPVPPDPADLRTTIQDITAGAPPVVRVTSVVEAGMVVVVDPQPGMFGEAPWPAHRTLVMHPGDAHRIRQADPLLALWLGLL